MEIRARVGLARRQAGSEEGSQDRHSNRAGHETLLLRGRPSQWQAGSYVARDKVTGPVA